VSPGISGRGARQRIFASWLESLGAFGVVVIRISEAGQAMNRYRGTQAEFQNLIAGPAGLTDAGPACGLSCAGRSASAHRGGRGNR
jgi:hypothetical protein